MVENSAVVSFIGSYSNIIKFLAKIENRPQKVLIHTLKMSTSDGKSNPLECEVTITIYTISEKEVLTNE